MITALVLAGLSGLAQPSADQLIGSLRRAHALSGRPVVEARRVCDLRLAAGRFPVIAVTDRYAAVEPRLYRRVVILAPDGRKADVIDYTLPAQPARCDADKLVFEGGDVTVGGGDGPVVRFSRRGKALDAGPGDASSGGDGPVVRFSRRGKALDAGPGDASR